MSLEITLSLLIGFYLGYKLGKTIKAK